jgi:hypothetical protein
MEPQSCPMCSRHSIEPLLGDVTMSAKLDRERLLGGIRGLPLHRNGAHILRACRRD